MAYLDLKKLIKLGKIPKNFLENIENSRYIDELLILINGFLDRIYEETDLNIKNEMLLFLNYGVMCCMTFPVNYGAPRDGSIGSPHLRRRHGICKSLDRKYFRVEPNIDGSFPDILTDGITKIKEMALK
jgi:hypothetical protein